MILFADSGSTKTEWILMKSNQEFLKTETIGLNPYFVDESQIHLTLNESTLVEYKDQIEEIHFYGAGCSNKVKVNWLQAELQIFFKNAKIIVKTDIEGAVLAASGGEASIVCILGTGSTFRIFNGNTIIRKYSSLSYILGDEGSGTYIAKQLLRGVFYGNFDQALRDQFFQKYPINAETLLEKIYKEPQANRFLASFVPFCKEHINHPKIKALVLNSFEQFYLEHLAKYSETKSYPIHFIGSIALHFEDELHETALKHQFKIGRIIQKPLTSIIENYKII